MDTIDFSKHQLLNVLNDELARQVPNSYPLSSLDLYINCYINVYSSRYVSVDLQKVHDDGYWQCIVFLINPDTNTLLTQSDTIIHDVAHAWMSNLLSLNNYVSVSGTKRARH